MASSNLLPTSCHLDHAFCLIYSISYYRLSFLLYSRSLTLQLKTLLCPMNSSSSTHKTHLKSNAVESHILHSTSYVAAYIQCSALYILCCISFIACHTSYILHPKSCTPHLKSMHWGKHSVQHSTLCIIHSTSYIATYILFPDVQHSAMSFVLDSKYSLLSVTLYILYPPIY